MNKVVLFIVLSFCFMVLPVIDKPVLASAPDIIGVVQTSTGAPIPGVWVKWKDSRNPYVNHPSQERYVQADSSGNYIFPSWHLMTQEQREAEYNTMIDTNLDGTPETHKASDPYEHHFGCTTGPHTFSVIPPANWNYTGDQIQVGIPDFANARGSLSAPPIVVIPPVAPVPTLTPMPQVFCACDGVSVAGPIEGGGQITVSGKAMVTRANSATSKVNSMTYTVKKNGQTVSTSSPISIIQLAGTNDSYQSTFPYTIPTAGAGEAGSTVRYTVDAAIQCGTKTPATTTSGAQANTQGLVGFIRSLFGLSNAPSSPTPTIAANNSQIQNIQAPEAARTLQFGTFSISTPTPTPYLNPQCSSVEFDVKY